MILGGGVTGLAAGWASGLAVFEAESAMGGICSSYYVRPNTSARLPQAPADGEAYRFELGGGHWIFGGDPAILRFIRTLTPVKTYQRLSSVFFPDQGLYVPYPLQNHLGYLSNEVRTKALQEMLGTGKGSFRTMEEWLSQNFGPTLTEAFFGPFHELYTAGLWKQIAPQDAYKSPVDSAAVIRGAFETTAPVGYNTSYIYPEEGLNILAQRMAGRCRVQLGKRIKQIDLQHKKVVCDDGSETAYQTLISTLPLNKMVEMLNLKLDEAPDPYTSVLVLNIGATRREKCPADHWIYLSKTRSGFHRVGFYSNVDSSFLPKSSRAIKNRVSIYVEKAFPGGRRPSAEEVANYSAGTVKELQEWGFIEGAEVVDPTWIDVAYTWSWPGSRWRGAALKKLEELEIQMVGRYARWNFQGIADSIRDGLMVGAAAKRVL
ncbi:MAG: FAD-dependent oxidoreductase [Acidobacteriota bacterium]|nr:FAD-dependent oxidoreductase [Acidobacteriota bacterium]